MPGATNDTHGQAMHAAIAQRSIATDEKLIADLSPRIGIAAAMTSIDNHRPEVAIVLIPARQHD